MVRINIGCAHTPTPGWLNFDNSLSVRIGKYLGFAQLLSQLGLITESQLALARVAAARKIVWADAVRRIPLPNASVSVAYSSHVLEHLDRVETRRFLAEVRRVLVPGGVFRLAVPDLAKIARAYVDGHIDADGLVAATHLADEGSYRGLLSTLRFLLVGSRCHKWMYDRRTVVHLLETSSFREVVELPAGATTIPDPGELNLREREDESIYVEARR